MNKALIKKRIFSVLMIPMLLLGIIGCADFKKSDKVQITMYLWDRPMMKELTPWLENSFPDIDFNFVIGYNTMEYYTYLNERESLPDIITCRRFSLNDAIPLSDKLMDLSETDVAGSFYDSYINNNREPEGAIRWLPICAEVDGYIANLDLFKKHNIFIPTNEAEFADACKKFEELGIRGYINDYGKDYSCMEALQGCAIPELTGLDGVLWRTKYENEADETAVSLDDKVWPAVFKKFEQYLADTRAVPSDLELNYQKMIDSVLQEKCAVMRGTAGDCLTLRSKGINAVMLPYFGETKNDNWVLTYPAFQVAVNKSVEQDKKKNKAVNQVLRAMFSEEGQKAASAGDAVLTYNKNTAYEPNEAFAYIEDCIESNRMYMRLASTEMFSVSKEVVKKMMLGEYGAKGAYDDFNSKLTADKKSNSPELFMTQNTAYEYNLKKHGSEAASSVVNTYRRQSGDDIAIGYSSVVSSSIFKGDYTRTQLNWLLPNWADIRSGELTGAQVKTLMEWLINTKDDGSNPIRHKNLLPVTSGMEYKIKSRKDGTYTLKEITVYGKPLQDGSIYKVSIFGDLEFIENPKGCNCPMPTELKNKLELQNTDIYTLFQHALENGKQMAEPTEYVTVK